MIEFETSAAAQLDRQGPSGSGVDGQPSGNDQCSHRVVHPYSIPTTGHYGRDSVSRQTKIGVGGWTVPGGRTWENTQIYEGANQIQRVVIIQRLLG